MLIIKTVYEHLKERLTELQTDRTEHQAALNTFKAEGDLSENNDYIQEKQAVDNITSEINNITTLLKEADILYKEPGTDFNIIELGCKFKMTISTKGDFFKFGNSKSIKAGLCDIVYNKIDEITSISGIFCFGGPTDICSEINILSSESPLGKLLMNKSMTQSSLKLKDNFNNLDILIERVKNNEVI